MSTGDTTGHAVTVLVAEYESLRAEMGRRAQTQNTLMSLALTLSGGLLAYGLAKQMLSVLLLHPLIASGLGLLWADNAFAKECIARYIRKHTQPRVQELTGLGVMHWQSEDGERARGWRGFWLFMPGVAFFLGPAATVVLTRPAVFAATHAEAQALRLSPGVIQLMWWVGLALVVSCAVGFFRAFVHALHKHGDYTRCSNDFRAKADAVRGDADRDVPAGA